MCGAEGGHVGVTMAPARGASRVPHKRTGIFVMIAERFSSFAGCGGDQWVRSSVDTSAKTLAVYWQRRGRRGS